MSLLFLLRNSCFQLQHLILKSVESLLSSLLSVAFFQPSVKIPETLCPLFSLPSQSPVMCLSWLQFFWFKNSRTTQTNSNKIWLINGEFARIVFLFCILYFFESFKTTLWINHPLLFLFLFLHPSHWTISDPLRKDNLFCFSPDLEGRRMTVVSQEPQLHLPTSSPTNHAPPPPPQPPPCLFTVSLKSQMVVWPLKECFHPWVKFWRQTFSSLYCLRLLEKCTNVCLHHAGHLSNNLAFSFSVIHILV